MLAIGDFFGITKTLSKNRQQVENFQFLVSKLSIARQNAVSQRNNILTDRNFIWFCGKNLGDTISLIECSTVLRSPASFLFRGHMSNLVLNPPIQSGAVILKPEPGVGGRWAAQYCADQIIHFQHHCNLRGCCGTFVTHSDNMGKNVLWFNRKF